MRVWLEIYWLNFVEFMLSTVCHYLVMAQWMDMDI